MQGKRVSLQEELNKDVVAVLSEYRKDPEKVLKKVGIV